MNNIPTTLYFIDIGDIKGMLFYFWFFVIQVLLQISILHSPQIIQLYYRLICIN